MLYLSRIIAAATLCCLASAAPSSEAPGGVSKHDTSWKVRSSMGFDALCVLNVLSDDPYYVEKYPEEARMLQSGNYDAARKAARRLKAKLKDENGRIISAFLTLILSGGPDASIDDLLESVRSPAKLRSSLERSPFWSDGTWNLFEATREDVIGALDSLKQAGFETYWRSNIEPEVAKRSATLLDTLSKHDVTGELTRLRGDPIDPNIEVIVLYFSRPHGIRIQGARFLTNAGYPAEIVLRNATHEVLHPTLDVPDPRAREVIARVGGTPLLSAIIAKHNRSFGYNSAPGLLDEDAVQALEQVASEHLGFALEAKKRWLTADEGMHVHAAVLYDLMRETGYAEHGGKFLDWLAARDSSGDLSADAIEKRARRFLGDEAVDRWLQAQ